MKWLALLFLTAGQAHAWTLLSSDLLGWPAPKLNVYVSPGDCLMDEETLFARVDEAIGAWNRTPYSALQLVRPATASTENVSQYLAGSATLVPVILCDTNFGSNQNANPDGVPAMTRVTTTDSRIHYAGVILNAQSGAQAALPHLSESELRITLAHEMGHMLGLGHSSDEEALMYYSIHGKEQLVLSQDDMDGLSYLYPRNEFQREAFGVSCQAVHRGNARPWTVLWAMLFVLGNIGAGRLLRPERLL